MSAPENGRWNGRAKVAAVVLACLLQLLGGAVAYGRLIERVDRLGQDVHELRLLILGGRK
jgi:hypothetical protein